MGRYPYGHPYYGHPYPVNVDDDSVSIGDQAMPGTYRTEIDVEHRNPTDLAIVEANLAALRDRDDTRAQLEEDRSARILATPRIAPAYWVPFGIWLTFVAVVTLSILFMGGVGFTRTSVFAGIAACLIAALPVGIIYSVSDAEIRQRAR